MEDGLLFQQGNTAFQNLINIVERFIRFSLPRKIEQAANDVPAAIGLNCNFFNVASAWISWTGMFPEVGGNM